MPDLYHDVARLLAEGAPEPPKPTIGHRTDGTGLIYAGAVNGFFGPPESGKTLAASCIVTDTLFSGGSALIVDVDHNGAPATIARFRSFGVSTAVLSDRTRFRYADPEERDHLLAIVKDSETWQPTVAVLDSVGEIGALFGRNSNDADDYRHIHRATLSAISRHGTAVVAIDHEAKSSESRSYGASGSHAKKAAIDGSYLRFAIKDPFTPGHGGRAHITIAKDRHGGLRAGSPVGEREPLAATFQLINHEEAIDWKFWAPKPGESVGPGEQVEKDAAAIAKLDPPPTTVDDAQKRLGVRKERAAAAMRHWRASQTDDGSRFPTPTPGTGNHTQQHSSQFPEPTGTDGTAGSES